MNPLTPLITEVASLLQTKQWQLVTAESCTGGMVAALLTEIPGSSNWFERGFVTYSNLAKEEMIAVPHRVLAEYGAVSEPVAEAMARGALAHSAGHIALAITGVAGPGGGTEEKPVGTVCFAWAAQGMPVKTVRKQFNGTRQEIRVAACYEALSGVLHYLSS